MIFKIKFLLSMFKFLLSKSEYKFIKKADIIVSSSDSDKAYFYDNKFYSPAIDPFAEYLKDKNYTLVAISTPGSKLFKDQTSLQYLNINREYYFSKIKSYFLGKKEEVFFWKKILEKIKPKIIICIQPKHELCVAAKLSKITIVDLQHGLVDTSVYYNLKNPYGRKGLPNSILCWDINTKNYLKKILPSVPSIVFGNPWITKFQQKNSNKFIYIENKKLDLIKSKKPVVIITLQWKKNFSKKNIDIPNHVVESLRILLNKGWNCWIRFHPAHVKEFNRSTLHQNWNKTTKLNINFSNVYDVTDFALPYLLKFSNVHITNYSSAIIESKILKVNSYIWCDDKKILFSIKSYLNSKYINNAPKNRNKLVSVLSRHKIKKKLLFNYLNNSEIKYKSFINNFKL